MGVEQNVESALPSILDGIGNIDLLEQEQTDKTSFFKQLGLPDQLIKALQTLGFNEPTPIQAQAIPALLSGSDVLGQAQTGTGKTAAFALPLLARVDIDRLEPQILVLTPTRELAIQVADAFNDFAKYLKGIQILPIYGGAGFSSQLSELRRGVHIVIGTPGRVMDHMRRESLKLNGLSTLILDEADEMLRMGFAEDVEWILQQVPEQRQIGLFSATMPSAIKAIAETHLQNPQRITIKNKTSTASTIQQYYWSVSNMHKVDALARIIETQDTDAVIVFVKTKRATEEVAERLNELGFQAVAINGDIVQQQRERVIDQLRQGKIKILIATDVAARGIDVERITHVINYDAPNNTESYVHRIGRTGRAGRAGTAIIFITPRERYILRNIENATKQPIAELPTPSIKMINERRIAAFKQRITDGSTENISFFLQLVNEYIAETGMPAETVAAVLARLLQGNTPLVLKKEIEVAKSKGNSRDSRERGSRFERSDSRSSERGGRDSDRRGDRSFGRDSDRRDRPAFGRDSDRRERSPFGRDSDRRERSPFGRDSDSRGARGFDRNSDGRRERPNSVEAGMDQYRVELGRNDGIMPKNLVGAIANTAGIEGRNIGRIKIEDRFSVVDLPKGLPSDLIRSLASLKVGGKPMQIKKIS